MSQEASRCDGEVRPPRGRPSLKPTRLPGADAPPRVSDPIPRPAPYSAEILELIQKAGIQQECKRQTQCVVPSCSNRPSMGMSFFRFPVHDNIRCERWLSEVDSDKLWHLERNMLSNKRVCAAHFLETSFLSPARNRLVHNAIPTLFGDEARKNARRDKEQAKWRQRNSVLADDRGVAIEDDAMDASTQTVSKAPRTVSRMTQTGRRTLKQQEALKEHRRLVTHRLRNQINYLQRRIQRMQAQLEQPPGRKGLTRGLEEVLSGDALTLCRLQVRSGGKGQQFTEEERAMALSLYDQGPLAYRYLRANGFILPSLSVIKRWEKESRNSDMGLVGLIITGDMNPEDIPAPLMSMPDIEV